MKKRITIHTQTHPVLPGSVLIVEGTRVAGPHQGSERWDSADEWYVDAHLLRKALGVVSRTRYLRMRAALKETQAAHVALAADAAHMQEDLCASVAREEKLARKLSEAEASQQSQPAAELTDEDQAMTTREKLQTEILAHNVLIETATHRRDVLQEQLAELPLELFLVTVREHGLTHTDAIVAACDEDAARVLSVPPLAEWTPGTDVECTHIGKSNAGEAHILLRIVWPKMAPIDLAADHRRV